MRGPAPDSNPISKKGAELLFENRRWLRSFHCLDLRPGSVGFVALARPSSRVVMTASIVSDAEEWVKSELAGQDGSHDWWHIVRVRATALSLAHEENLPTSSMRTVELAALLHDVRDWKYSGDANAGAEAVRSWLTDHGHPTDDTATVVEIVSKMGFKEELSAEASTSPEVLSPEFKVVQDADRLDAIGALGIARTFCYGGSRGDPMHVPGVSPRVGLTKAEYMDAGTEHVNTVVNHFHEKLLRLRDMMKSESGRRRAEGRHAFMLEYLEQFHGEWDGDR